MVYLHNICKWEAGSGGGKRYFKIESGDTDFSIITLLELSVAMETRVLFRSGPKPNEAFPQPSDASKFGCDRPIGLRDIHV